MNTRNRGGCTLLMALLGSAACAGPEASSLLEPAASLAMAGAPAPSPLVWVTLDGTPREIWPFTGTRLSDPVQDPINLIFLGEADPRNVRNALMSLNGSRMGPFAPFACTWRDAIGGIQTAYTTDGGWSGSVIQLECGDYDPFRFHIRIFPAGSFSVANAHVDVLITGTTDHQVLSWELGEQLVAYDLVRSGFAGTPQQTGKINPWPIFKTIPPIIYNSLPVGLRALTGGPLPPATAIGPVGIPNSGNATIVPLAAAPAAAGTSQDISVPFAQSIPKPFCNAGNEWVRVDGTVRLSQRVAVSAAGVLTSQTVAEGDLEVRSIDPTTGALGPAVPARVRDHYHTSAHDHSWRVESARKQQLTPVEGPIQQLIQQLTVGSTGGNRFRLDERCD
jgi:hypothetical protein